MFKKIEEALSKDPKKVLIVEENAKHAQALAYFLQQFNVASEIKNSVGDGIQALNRNEVDCVILDMGIPTQNSYETLEEVKQTPGLENLPIIIFTGKNISHVEEKKIRQYADSIVIKTAHSYQRILDEVSLFLHLVEENKKNGKASRQKRIGAIGEVLKGKTVLVVDDDARNIFSLTKSLENYEINVISAIDGKDALKQLEDHDKVDIVLMDMMMPEMDGYESTRRIRTISKYKSLPIIAVTAKAMTGDREKCIEAGTSDYTYQTGRCGSTDFVIKSLALLKCIRKMEAANKTILIIDDDARNIFALKAVLQARRYHILEAPGVEEGINILQSSQPVDVILMDMMMPGMDGYEAIPLIKQHEQFSEIPVIAVTAQAMTGDREKCLAAGAADYISKPIDVDKLIEVLNKYLK